MRGDVVSDLQSRAEGLLNIQTLPVLLTTWDFYRVYKYVHVNLMLRKDWTETL